MARRYVVLDVFTDRLLAGNGLAVVLDSQGLDDEAMQAIAREFNLSETVFVLPPESERHKARLRIFTPGRELPFAGHPTIGTAVLLALDSDGGVAAQAFGLEERVGVVSCVAERLEERRGRARFKLPRLPEFWGEGRDIAAIAEALEIDAADIGFDKHRPSQHSAGVPFDFVPIRSLEAIGRARPGATFSEVFGGDGHVAAYLYTRETIEPGSSYHARMFAPGMGLGEDPATGSAAAAFAGVLMQFEPMGAGTHDVIIEQGYEMGRSSIIALQIEIENGKLVSGEIGGEAVIVARGELYA